MTKLIITVSGGIIQHIASNTGDVQIVIADHDNLKEEFENQSPLELYQPDDIFSNGEAVDHLPSIGTREDKIVSDFLTSINF